MYNVICICLVYLLELFVDLDILKILMKKGSIHVFFRDLYVDIVEFMSTLLIQLCVVIFTVKCALDI